MGMVSVEKKLAFSAIGPSRGHKFVGRWVLWLCVWHRHAQLITNTTSVTRTIDLEHAHHLVRALGWTRSAGGASD